MNNEFEMTLSEFGKVLNPVGRYYNFGRKIVKVLAFSHINHGGEPVYRQIVVSWEKALTTGAIHTFGIKRIYDTFNPAIPVEIDENTFFEAYDAGIDLLRDDLYNS